MAEQQVSFKDTLNLPRTDFSIRANAQETDPILIKRWQDSNLYQRTFHQNQGAQKFILHDGPPYSNGHIHLGHAYNKILKDIVLKSRRMMGHHAPCTPGWDCHGLPIELKVTQEYPQISSVQLKKTCREYAKKWIDIQRAEFKQLGVLMDWDKPYLTMSFEYERSILKAFATFVAAGYIERKNKTVPWCISCKTVLAAAEIEYEDRKDPSIYVKFQLDNTIVNALFPQLAQVPINCLIWTTTPWTLPLNRAVLIRPDETYSIIKVGDDYIIVGAQRADALCIAAKVEKQHILNFNSSQLLDLNARLIHPFISNLTVPLIADASVELTEGTAFVHCAPGAGPIDYEIGIRHNLEIFSPVEESGKYTELVQPQELMGKSILDGQGLVITKLMESGKLFYKSSIHHSYPHCWRCHNGLIFRATKQWFFNLDKAGVKQKTLDVIPSLRMYPESSRNRLSATVDGRLEWCISRQRVWGVPIPALICTQCDYTHMDSHLISIVADHIGTRGIEYWDESGVSELISDNFACPSCKNRSWQKEMDILDVWFESGVSHFAVLQQNPELAFPADLYLEGKDQHRAWFQSSLLISIALDNRSCTKGFLTHGFTVDAQGKKMSKSLGNVVAPQDIVNKIGTDGLRLWVASIDYTDDAVVSDKLLTNVQEVLRKVRNTCRFLLSNLYDFDIEKDAIPLNALQLLDQRALHELQAFRSDILDQYEKYNFTAIFHKLADYCTVNLSSFYLDIVKDRLYVEKADGNLRRSAQTTCWHILDTLTKLMAPILSFTSEQIFDHYKKQEMDSIHLQSFRQSNAFDAYQSSDQSDRQWELIKDIRGALLKAIEEKRSIGLVKHSLEVQLTLSITLDESLANQFNSFLKGLTPCGQSLDSFFKELLIVSQVTILSNPSEAQALETTEIAGLSVRVAHASGNKCPRCWQWSVTQHQHHLCSRCNEIVR